VPPPGWTLSGDRLTWTAVRPVPTGDAAIEFYAGDRLLGRPESAPDQRSFVLVVRPAAGLADLQVRAGGRRLDVAAAPAESAGARPVIPRPRPANAVDPGTIGPYRTVTGDYRLPDVRLARYPTPVEMRAIVVAPRGAPGPRPLALFLHGRHWTCYGARRYATSWPCPRGSRPVPSYRGFRQAQRLLASQGYVTVSISANGISAQDWRDVDAGIQSRSSLVRMHLAQWARWSSTGRAGAPAIVRAAPRADLSRVLLIGHSRGGEGVSRVAVDSLDPPPWRPGQYDGPVRWRIRGLVLIGPTAFGQNPAPDVPSVTILPGCDGDLGDLEGQAYVDGTRGVSRGAALHSSLYVIGANHNYFDTEWTPGQATDRTADDDFDFAGDPLCSSHGPSRLTSGRLTPHQQQTVGATYIAAAARVFIAGDDRVRPLLDGTGLRAPSADPARVLSSALGGGRIPVIVPERSLGVRHARLCAEVTTDPAAACLRRGSPHFVPFGNVRSEVGRYAVALTGRATVVLRPDRPTPLGASQALELRLIVPPNTVGNRFAVAVRDARGRRIRLGTVRVDGLPGTAHTSSYWAQEVRVRLPRTVRTVTALELTPRSRRPSWLLDAWGWRPGIPPPRPAALIRADVAGRTVVITGRGRGTIRIFRHGTAREITVRPGTRLTLRHPGFATAVRHAMIGAYG
jgi:hypothetical protein